uniref:Protein ovo n=1 Tax=Rhabditophanes sp. KR3021 TaxID=114890 RepID=A0AC35TSC9_9BILA
MNPYPIMPFPQFNNNGGVSFNDKIFNHFMDKVDENTKQKVAEQNVSNKNSFMIKSLLSSLVEKDGACNEEAVNMVKREMCESPHNNSVIPVATQLPYFPVAQSTSLEYVNGGYGVKNPLLSCSLNPPDVDSTPAPSARSGEFICRTCNKKFTLQRLLNRHVKCHSELKRYLCTVCAKGFNDTFDLKRHTRTHTGVRPYKCDHCEKSFTQRCSLESHLRKVHGQSHTYGYKQRRAKVFVCEDCGYSHANYDDYISHLRITHPLSAALLKLTSPMMGGNANSSSASPTSIVEFVGRQGMC